MGVGIGVRRESAEHQQARDPERLRWVAGEPRDGVPALSFAIADAPASYLHHSEQNRYSTYMCEVPSKTQVDTCSRVVSIAY